MREAKHSVVLANDSRLLRDMFSRVLTKRSSLRVAAQIDGNAMLSKTLGETEADCVITSIDEHDGNRAGVESILLDHQEVLFVFLALDRSTVRIQNAGEQRIYEHLSLQELIKILERE